MKQTMLLAMIGLALVAVACGNDVTATQSTTSPDENTTRLWVGPETADCVGESPRTCMLVSETGPRDYEFFYDGIEGFTHTAGTSYVIDVEVTQVEDPPADGSSLAYRLVRVVEETPAG